jgi:hypothetical protein
MNTQIRQNDKIKKYEYRHYYQRQYRCHRKDDKEIANKGWWLAKKGLPFPSFLFTLK